MKVQPASFLRTTLPLDLSNLAAQDSGRYHSIWLPDHMVSFWPDSIWTPEFTDLATASPSPHRHLDAMAVAGAVAVLTKNVPIATSVVDTVRRHPAMLAQTALTLDHLAKGRFILGVGSGETENTVPYGFDFAKSVSRFEEALKVIKLLWESGGPVDFQGQFYHLHHARMDTEPFRGPVSKNMGGLQRSPDARDHGPLCRRLVAGRRLDARGVCAKTQGRPGSAEASGRDPMALVPASIQTCLISHDEAELSEILNAPLVKAWVLQPSAEALRKLGFEHPLGEAGAGIKTSTRRFCRGNAFSTC